MSKVKSPKQKKEISLQRDRRNVYGESKSASRKGIRRGKQRSHMEQRRAVNEELRSLRVGSTEADGDVAEARLKDRAVVLKRASFKKRPDAPLGEVVQKKLKERAEKAKPRRKR
jgi:hypothetical protein